MGQNASQIQNDHPNNTATFVNLPKEVRIYMLFYIPPLDRTALRLVCCKLYNDIDEYIGPSNCLNLNDLKSIKIYEFYSRTFFPEIEISKSCLFDGFQNILYRPARIRTLTLKKPDGIINSNFLEEFLEKAKGLNALNLNGIIIGPVSRQSGVIFLPYLKILQLLISDEIFKIIRNSLATTLCDLVQGLLSNPTKIQSILKTWWETQLALLKRLSVPACEEIVLGLNYRPNLVQEDFDEIELVQTVFDFIARHPNCQRIKILSRVFLSSWTPESINFAPLSQYSFYHQRQKALQASKEHPQDPLQGPEEVQLPPLKSPNGSIKMEIKEITYASEIVNAETTLETHLYQFLKSLEGLEKLNITNKWPRSIQLPLFVQIVRKNAATLTEIVITGRTQSFRNIPEFAIFSTSPCLKTLWIDIILTEGNLPFNLTPTEDTIANLKTLVLKGAHLIDLDHLKSIPDLVNLSYLCLTGVWSTIWMTVPLDTINCILNMKSLEGVIIPMGFIVYPEGANLPPSPGGLKIFNALLPFVKPASYELCISDRVTPWWTRMEKEIVEYHEPGRIVSG